MTEPRVYRMTEAPDGSWAIEEKIRTPGADRREWVLIAARESAEDAFAMVKDVLKVTKVWTAVRSLRPRVPVAGEETGRE